MADYVVERARSDPKVQKIVEDARLYDGLREHAGWQRLYDALKENRSRFMVGVAKRLMAGEAVDQREIDYQRGFYDGAKYVIKRPEEAAMNLEAAASKAYALAKIELASEVQDESPYL